MRNISIVLCALSLLVLWGSSEANPPPVFTFNAQSMSGSGVSGSGNSNLSAQSGSAVLTSTYLIPTPHGISANSSTHSTSWGNSGGYGGTTGFEAQALGGSGVSGTLPFHPLNLE